MRSKPSRQGSAPRSWEAAPRCLPYERPTSSGRAPRSSELCAIPGEARIHSRPTRISLASVRSQPERASSIWQRCAGGRGTPGSVKAHHRPTQPSRRSGPHWISSTPRISRNFTSTGHRRLRHAQASRRPSSTGSRARTTRRAIRSLPTRASTGSI